MTRLIGYRWKYSDVWSRVVLIARSLPQFFFKSACLKKCNLNASFSQLCQRNRVFFQKWKRQQELLVVIARGFTSSHSEQRS